MDASEIVIKKYPNRRLYDTSSSAYVTLDDVKRLVVQRRKVRVVDAKTEEDLTRQTLMQILLEEEAGGRPLFSEEALAFMISSYGQAQHGALAPFMEASLQAYARGAEAMAKQAQALRAGGRPAPDAALPGPWGEIAKAQQAAVGQIFDQWSQAAGQWMKPARAAKPAKDDKAGKESK